MKNLKQKNISIPRGIFYSLKIYYTADRKHSVIYLLFKILSLAFMSVWSILYMLLPKYFIDAIVEQRDFRLAVWILAEFCVLDFLLTKIDDIVAIKSRLITADINKKIEKNMLEKAALFPYEKFEEADYYDKYARSAEYVQGGSDKIIGILFDFANSFVSFVAASVIVCRLNVWVFVTLILLIVVRFLVKKNLDKASFQVRQEMTRLNRRSHYLSSLLNDKNTIKDVKLGHLIWFIGDKYEGYYQDAREKKVALEKKRFLLNTPSTLVNILYTIALYLSLGKSLFESAITLGDYSTMLNAAQMLRNYIQMMLDNITSLRNHTYNVKCLLDFMEYDIEEKPALSVEEIDEINFSHVSYKYPGQERYAVEDVSFTVKKGEKLSIVGQNGAGKTTLVNLMMGLLKPTEGQVYVNGYDISKYNTDGLYSKIAVVFQNHNEYAFTIGENILMRSCESKEDEKLAEFALEKSHLSEKIGELKDGLNTTLTRLFDDSGVDFSGGERQKLAIARAYAKNAGFVIMDEPASSLDAIAEFEICDDMLRLSENKTVVMISHRLITIKNSEKIVVMDGGRIIEEGTHRQLMERDGLYARMYTLQNEE